MLGYMTAKEALEEGFTHHGSYYGIPIWITDDELAPMVATKWAPLEVLMTLFHYLEAFFQGLFYPDEEPGFCLLIGKPIEPPKP